jgi:hypothetical protein
MSDPVSLVQKLSKGQGTNVNRVNFISSDFVSEFVHFWRCMVAACN